MSAPILEFAAPGSPREVSSAIEACAAERRMVNALVVPWESTADVLTMAVTSSTVDGWAIQHTNLGSIVLARLDDRQTRVSVVASESLSAAADKRDELTALLAAFARQIEKRLAPAGQAR
jgi:hypothetical protein